MASAAAFYDNNGELRLEGQLVGGAVLTTTVTLTNAQILSLPTTPVVLVPATQVLAYTGAPATLPVPVLATLVVRRSAAAYTNVDAACLAHIAWGSDESLDVSGVERPIGTEVVAGPAFGGSGARGLAVWGNVNLFPPSTLDGDFQDNALSLAVHNGSAGDFTGGDAANTATIVVYYTVASIA